MSLEGCRPFDWSLGNWEGLVMRGVGVGGWVRGEGKGWEVRGRDGR